MKYETREEAIGDHRTNYRVQGGLKGKYNFNGPDRHRIGMLQSNIPNGSVVLDIGCNDGSLGMLLQNKECVVYGVDVVPQLINVAMNKGVLARVAPAEELPYRKHLFEAVVMAEVLEHLFEPRDGLREVVRVLRPDGVFVGSVPHADGNLGRTHPGGDYHQSMFEYDELENLLKEFFEEVKITPVPVLLEWAEDHEVNGEKSQWNTWTCRKPKG